MNSHQLQSMYVTADLVTRNSNSALSLEQLRQLQQLQQQPQSIVPPITPHQQEQVNVNDIFEIPEFDTPVISNPRTQQTITTNYKTTVGPSPTGINLISSINQNTMTDVMKQIANTNALSNATSNANQKQKTPSVSTKHTEQSIQTPKQQLPPQILSSGSASSAVGLQQPVANSLNGVSSTDISTVVVKKSTTKPKCKNTINKKVIVEDEDKDSSVDYDDDDPEIKKTKLSLFHFAKDITFNLIFAIPFLQKARLNAMLRDPTLAITQIERIFDEFKDQMTQFELESIKKYVCEDGIRDQLNYILESGFNKILSDGVIDINDAPQFNQLVFYIIKSFNDINDGKVYRFYVSREHVMLLLHFVLKSVFALTLKGQEEQMAIGLLDTSFKLVKLEVLPIVSKRWYHKFRICKSAKQIEDIIE